MTRLALTFQALRIRNYRLYFTGQTVSLIGTWMQRVGQSWLVLELTGSGTLIGVTAALQFLPLLLAGPWGGLIADRVDKRRLLLVTQSVKGLLALVLALLTGTGLVQLWMVLVLAFALGMVAAIDAPSRHSFVLEMVGVDVVRNAVTLNSVLVNGARVIGPAVAGVLIAHVGFTATFATNAASYFAVVFALWAMRDGELQRAEPTRRGPGQLREGLRYVWRTPALRAPLLLMAVVGMLAYEFQVILPLQARFTFGGDAQTFGIMNSAMGVGAVVGGLATAGARPPSPDALLRAALMFGGAILATAAAPTFAWELVALLATGAASITFIATANSLLQLGAAPAMRGRVMALWSVAFMGTTPIGGPLIGWVGETVGPRFGLALGGVATILAALAAYFYLRRHAGNELGPTGVDTAPRPAGAPAPAPLSAAALATGRPRRRPR